jgi:hypothetical protein
VFKKYAKDASWGKESYDEALCSALLGTVFHVGHECFFLAGYLLALWATFVGPIPAGIQRVIDCLIAWALSWLLCAARPSVAVECHAAIALCLRVPISM